MPAGRPTKYRPEYCREAISPNRAEELFSESEFPKERDFCDFIENNMDVFMEDAFGDEVVRCVREARFLDRTRGPRVDFMVAGGRRKYLVECKNPTHVMRELVMSVSQLLYYGMLAGSEYELVLATSRYDGTAIRMVEHYSLPIHVCAISSEGMAISNSAMTVKQGTNNGLG